MIHGGPAGADFDAWQERWACPHNLMCQRGAYVLTVNYHGSSNYGLAWAESIAADPSVVENAKPGAPWRAQFGIQEAEGQLATGLEALVAVTGGAFDGSDPHRLASRLLRAGGERAV